MAEPRNDDKGYERGAKGIDGKEGENFGKNADASATNKQFGRQWPGGKAV